MNSRKLYIVEGIPGSGKTTTAKWLAQVLRGKGVDANLFLEGNIEHPADFESVACLRKEQMIEVGKEFPFLYPFVVQKQKWFFIPYAPFNEENPELYKALQKYDVYELSVEDFCEVTLMKWREFAEKAQSEDKVYVLECCFLQNPITFLLAKHDVPKEYIFKHIEKLAEIIANLNPVILYFEQDNIKESIDRVRKERSPEWFEFVIWYYTGQSYGKTHGLKGETGVIQFLENRKELEKEILSLLSIESLILNNSQYNWDKCRETILTFTQ